MLSLSYRDANSVDVSGGLETESSNGKDTLVSISFWIFVGQSRVYVSSF